MMTLLLRPLVSLVAITLLTGAAVPQVTGQWPTRSKKVNAEGEFWDKKYNNGVAKADWSQHVGVDLKASSSDSVYSPVEGFVIFNNTRDRGVTQGKAYIIIKDISTGWEHVLGHITSSHPVCDRSDFPRKCKEKARVYTGSYLGYPLPGNEFPAHVHWGVNKIGVSQSMGIFTGTKWKNASGKRWGWGRAPFEAEKSMACSLGWINPVNYNKCE